MDKRTLFFVIAMSIALFSINSFFSHLDSDRAKEWHEQQKKQKLALKEEIQTQLKSDVAPLSALPIEKVEGRFALNLAGSLLFAKGERPLPETLTFNGEGYVKKLYGELALFQKEGSAALPLKILPSVGGFDLQLLFLNREEAPELTLGEYVNTYVSMPASKLAKLDPKEFRAPKGVALALSKVGGEWALSGTFDTASGSFISVHEEKALLAIGKNLLPPEETITSDEEFFVLENAYQQLVFSNVGGALAEVNLPFRSDANKQSVVREIRFDREMVSENPQNARFPLHEYTRVTSEGKETGVQGKLGGYYPLLRRDLIEKPPYRSHELPSQFYAMNIVSEEFAEVAELKYRVAKQTENSITFVAQQPYRRVKKTFTIPKDVPYVVECQIEVEGDARGLWLTTGVPEVEWINGGIAPALKYRTTNNSGSSRVDSLSLPSPDYTSSSAVDWVCNSNGFFGMIIDPLKGTESGFAATKVPGDIAFSRLVEIDQSYQRFKAGDMPGYTMKIPFPARGGKMEFRLFAGPFATNILTAVDNHYSDSKTGYTPDYISSQTTHGWFTFISGPFSKFLFVLMRIFYAITSSWGLSIILLTLALRVMIYPLTAWSVRSSKKMQELAPALKAIDKKYKKDPTKANLEKAALFREKKVNPLSGCLPLLIQLPFFFGMFDLLKSAFELRGASFIPGWIDNLAAPDVLFSWDYPLYFIGTEFHLLPILAALAMFGQMKLMQPKKDPSEMTEQERTQQSMGTIMTLPFVFIFYNAPSGLCIYWVFSTLFGMIQHKFTKLKPELKKKKK